MILLLSMLSGFPSNARNTRILYDTEKISLDEANHILIFSHFSNPIFILTTVGVFFFKNEKLGIIILISHYISNFILGIFFRNKFKHIEEINKSYTIFNFDKKSFEAMKDMLQDVYSKQVEIIKSVNYLFDKDERQHRKNNESPAELN